MYKCKKVNRLYEIGTEMSEKLLLAGILVLIIFSASLLAICAAKTA